ncbi:unnamed protein product [Aphanomyces euteiches]
MKAQRAEEALRQFQRRAEMPDSKAAQRDLRRGLEAQGDRLERYGESPAQRAARGVIMEKSDSDVGRRIPRGFIMDEFDDYGDDDDI